MVTAAFPDRGPESKAFCSSSNGQRMPAVWGLPTALSPAACAAALAGTFANAKDSPTKAEKVTLVKQARAWLQEDLDIYRQQLKDRKAGGTVHVEERLWHWLSDPDLAGVRDAKAIADLPEPEQAGWRQFWADVGQLLNQVRAGITSATAAGFFPSAGVSAGAVARMEGARLGRSRCRANHHRAAGRCRCRGGGRIRRGQSVGCQPVHSDFGETDIRFVGVERLRPPCEAARRGPSNPPNPPAGRRRRSCPTRSRARPPR